VARGVVENAPYCPVGWPAEAPHARGALSAGLGGARTGLTSQLAKQEADEITTPVADEPVIAKTATLAKTAIG
jgi:hypothetical protein